MNPHCEICGRQKAIDEEWYYICDECVDRLEDDGEDDLPDYEDSDEFDPEDDWNAPEYGGKPEEIS